MKTDHLGTDWLATTSVILSRSKSVSQEPVECCINISQVFGKRLPAHNFYNPRKVAN